MLCGCETQWIKTKFVAAGITGNMSGLVGGVL